MIDKNRLLNVSSLKLASIADELEGNKLKLYTADLNAFIESFPEQESGIRKTLFAKDFEAASDLLILIREALKSIYADGLADECLRLINDMDSEEPEKIESRIISLLSDMTTLSVDVQMAMHKEEKAEKDAPAPSERSESGGMKRILAVDDVVFFLQTLKTHLHGTGFELSCVSSGDDALRLISNGYQPDLVILDIEMPDMNGYKLAEKIKEQGVTAPIVFLTGNARKDYVMRAIRLGAADFLVKPINREQVLARIGKLI